ncbi:MAG: hypothetical protein HY532_02415 [Chloroflexi bacterium]|nr:hypothetical protein [Chloroflexota bacterium]
MDFIAIGIDPTEKLSDLVAYKQAQGYPWPVAEAPSGMLPAYSITTQSTKIGVDESGVITFREGYGVKSADFWNQVLQKLAS